MIEKYNFLLQITLIAAGNDNIKRWQLYAMQVDKKTVRKPATNNLLNRPLNDLHRNHYSKFNAETVAGNGLK